MLEKELEDTLKKEISKECLETNKAFINATRSNEILIIILKAHLYMERELILTLTETIIDEKVLKGTTFRQKLDLANSMGLVEGIYGALGKVNSIRNSYAHDVDYEFNEKTFEDLISTLSKENKDNFFANYDKNKVVYYDGTIPEFNFKIQLLLDDIWISLVSCRVVAKKAIELRLMQKEMENLSKRITISSEE